MGAPIDPQGAGSCSFFVLARQVRVGIGLLRLFGAWETDMKTDARDDELVGLVARLALEGADGRAGLGTLLREVESRYPGEIDRMASALLVQRLNETPFPVR